MCVCVWVFVSFSFSFIRFRRSTISCRLSSERYVLRIVRVTNTFVNGHETFGFVHNEHDGMSEWVRLCLFMRNVQQKICEKINSKTFCLYYNRDTGLHTRPTWVSEWGNCTESEWGEWLIRNLCPTALQRQRTTATTYNVSYFFCSFVQ